VLPRLNSKKNNKIDKMKNLLKKSAYKLFALLMILAASQTAVWAEDGKTANAASSLSAGQVVGAFALLMAVVLIPVFKSSRRVAK
jgi:hypothetical protein